MEARQKRRAKQIATNVKVNNKVSRYNGHYVSNLKDDAEVARLTSLINPFEFVQVECGYNHTLLLNNLG
jgi:hypothetical protein